MDKKVQFKGKELTYTINGNGPCVVLLHGFGEDGRVWQNQVAFLQPNYTVIVPYLPGSGASELLDDMSMESMAESVKAILENEGAAKCVLIGHSMGGYITLAFAQHHASMLAGFGLFHSTAYADTEEKIATRLKGIQFINKYGAFEFLKTVTPNLYSDATKIENAALVEDHIQHVSYFTNAALTAYYESMINRPNRADVLKQNKLPVLFVLGKHDAVVPLQDVLTQSYLPLQSHVHILNKSGHMGMVEERDSSNIILNDFLQNIAFS